MKKVAMLLILCQAAKWLVLLVFFCLSPIKYWDVPQLCVNRRQENMYKQYLMPLQKGFMNTSCGPIKASEDKSNMEELDLPTDFKDLPARIDWSAELPANIIVPRVDVHSLVLDFAAVSFLDISALKGLKTMLKELIRVEVDIYIVACDPYILEKLHNCCFFDDEVQPSMFFLTVHDAMLHVLEKHPESAEKKSDFDRIITTVTVHHPEGSLRSRDTSAPEPETRF